jgi:hypothetical protein
MEVSMLPHGDARSERDRQLRPRPNEEGIYLKDLAEGAVVELETQHHHYTLQKQAGSQVQISGHPTFCPEPIAVQIEGSVEGRPMMDPKPGYIGRGMHLIFKHPVFDSVTTSRIREIHSKSSTW